MHCVIHRLIENCKERRGTNFRQSGQAMVLYALLVPLLFLFVSVGMDLGWYYTNVSRLQNAADASAIAGARALIETDTETFSGYSIKIKLVNEYYGEVVTADEIVVSDVSVTKSTKSTTQSSKLAEALAKSNEAATEYVQKNLSDDDLADFIPHMPSEEQAILLADNSDVITDSWHRAGGINSKKVTVTPALYQDGEIFYYVVRLQETVDHLFRAGDYFEKNFPMNAPVVAVAMIAKSSDDDSSGDDTSVVTPAEPVTLIFDTNGGSFSNGTTTTSKSLTAPSEMEDGDTSSPLSSDQGTPTYSNNQK